MYFSDNEQLKNGKQRRKQMRTALFITHSITYAGSRQKKTASCFFQISGWLDNEEHEVRTGHTVER